MNFSRRDPFAAFVTEGDAEEVIAALASEDPAVRASAALRLALFDSPSSAAHLRRLLREDPDRRVRSMAGQSLLTRGDAGSMRAVSRFIEEMSISDARGALEAAYPVASALAIHVRHASTGLAPALGEGDLKVVSSALQALVDSANKKKSRLAGELSMMLESVGELGRL